MATQSTKSQAKSTSKKVASKSTKKTKKAPTRSAKTTAKAAIKTKAVAKKPADKTKKVVSKKTAKSTIATKQRFALLRRNNGLKQPKKPKVAAYSWNAWLTLIYAAQGAILLVASKSATVVPITLAYIAQDTLLTKSTGEATFSPAVQHLFDLDLSYAVAGLLFVLAIVHGVAAVRRATYETGVNTAASTFRWIVSTLAVGGSLLLLALILGIRDVVSLIALAAFIVLSSVVALVAEQLARDKAGIIHKTFLYRIHFAAYFVPVVAVAIALASSSVYDGQLPVFVNYLFASVVVLSFALTSIFRMQLAAEKKWANYAYAEKAYMVIACGLVSAAAWQIFAGLLK